MKKLACLFLVCVVVVCCSCIPESPSSALDVLSDRVAEWEQMVNDVLAVVTQK